MDCDLVIYRATMLAETNIARLYKKYCNKEVLGTAPITQVTDSMLSAMQGKTVLIIGGYYNEESIIQMKQAASVCNIIADNVPYDVENPEEHPHILRISNINTYVFDRIRRTIPVGQFDLETSIARFMDSIQSETPSEKAEWFKLGVYTLEYESLLEKLESLKSTEDLTMILEYGKIKQRSNNEIAKMRLRTAVEVPFVFKGETLTAMIGQGDSPVVESARILAENSSSGIGILLRHDYKNKRTFISMAVTLKSGVDAPNMMQDLFGGGGANKLSGGGSIDGLHFPDTLWNYKKV